MTHRLTIIALSSMMHPEPMTMGPEIANIVALGCTIVPVEKFNPSRVKTSWRHVPEPMVISPLSSTS